MKTFIQSSKFKVQNWFAWIAPAVIFLAQTARIFAAEPQMRNAPNPPVAQRHDTVIVPYDPKKPVEDQKPDKVWLKYDRFLELWEAAKRSRVPEKERPAAATFALGAARYEGRIEEKRVAFTATVDFTTFNEPWVRVPVPFTGVQISALAVDGQPAAFADNTLVVEKPGRHTLTLSFEIPLAPGARQFAWGIPRAAAARLVLALPETRWTARILSDAAQLGVTERTVDGKKTVTAALGDAMKVSVALVEAEGAARIMEPAAVAVETSVTVLPSHERFEVAADFSFAGAQQDRFTVSFEKGIALASLDAPGMKSWKLSDSGERQVLEVQLSQAVKEKYRLALVAERAQADALPADRKAPQFSAGAKRVNRTVLLYAGDGIALVPAPDAALRQVEIANRQDGMRAVGAWTGDAALGYRAALSEPKHEAHVDYVYQVNRRKIELIASLQLHAKDVPLFDALLTLPAGFEVQAVDSVRLQDWWREGGKLHVRFKGETPETTPLVVYLVREYAAAPQQLDVQPLALDGFAKVTGEAVIAAHKGVSATLALAADASPDAAKEVDPAKAARNFQILLPLERKRGFAFRNQIFSGQVALAALPVKQNATWMMHAEAHEGWLSLSMKAQIALRQGSIERTAFSLPAALPEAHVTGAEVRETRSHIEGDRRIYEVAFQNDVYDTVDFTVDVDLMMPEGKRGDRKVNELALPAPQFPEAIITNGYVIADNASEYELKLETEVTERALAKEIPWLPSVTKSAGIFRVQPQWKVALVLERLEKAEARTAFCAWAEMTTALREDGTEWHKAVWHLQNRSLQFLPVKLPDGAMLMSARVAGQNVRVDSGKVDGRAAVLIPLIKTRPGDVSYDVEVVWKQAGEKLGGRGMRKFRDAELIGITVEQTFWSVWLPEDRTLTKSDGNMEEVLAVAREVEKARSTVEEMALLNSIIADPNVSEDARRNAQSNWDAMCKQVQGQLTYNGGVLSDAQRKLNSYSGDTTVTGGVLNVKNKSAKEQSELVSKLEGDNTYLSSQLQRISDENKKIAQKRNVQPSVGNEQPQQQQAATLDANGLVQNTTTANSAQALLFGNNNYTGTTTISGGLSNTGNNAGNAGPGANAGFATVQNGIQAPANGVFNAQVQQGGQAFGNQRWSVNPSNTVQTNAEIPQEGNKPVSGKFYVNDNIVLQQEDQPQNKKTMSGSGGLKQSGAKDKGGKDGDAEGFKNADEFAAYAKGDAAKAPAKPKPNEPDEKNRTDADDRESSQDRSRSFNYARGNRQQFEDQQKEASNSELKPQSQPTVQPPAPPVPLQPGASVPASRFGAIPEPNVMPRPALDSHADGTGSIVPQRPLIQQGGRLALEVDFPTTGHVHHFQKTKASAVIEVSFADPRIAARWVRTGMFAGAAVLLMLAGRFLSARRARLEHRAA